MLPSNQYVEIRNGGYYLSGTRIPLDVLIHAFREGIAPEEFHQKWPASQTLEKVYGACTFILAYPEAVETYLADQARSWEEFKRDNPLPQELIERTLRAREAKLADAS